jgi:hypothetical protein
MYVTFDSHIGPALQSSEASDHRFVSRASHDFDRTLSVFHNEGIHSYLERDVLFKISDWTLNAPLLHLHALATRKYVSK